MTRPTETIEVDYPETDGLPMGESVLHRFWMSRLIALLEHRYAGQRVFVGGNLMFYYREGQRDSVCPDAFVVKDCDPNPPREIFKTWVEPRAPHAVFEVTSRTTRLEDEQRKPAVYAEIGVAEYFLYDPKSEYLVPPLQGYRLSGDRYERIEPDAEGRLASEELDLWLSRCENDLVLTDRTTGRILQTAREAAETERDAAEAKRDAAEAERDAARAEYARAQAEIERLRKLLRDAGSDEDE